MHDRGAACQNYRRREVFARAVTVGKGSAAEGTEAQGFLVMGNNISLTVANAECYHDSLVPCGCVGLVSYGSRWKNPPAFFIVNTWRAQAPLYWITGGNNYG